MDAGAVGSLLVQEKSKTVTVITIYFKILSINI